MKRPWYYHITWLICFPSDVVAWLVALIVYVAWGRKLHWNNGLWCELMKDSWPAKTWYKNWGGTTLGHGGFYNFDKTKGEGIDTDIEFHEHIHVEQYEAGMVRAFLIGLYVFVVTSLFGQPGLGLLIGLSIWANGAIWTFGPNWMQAIIRGESAYRGSHHEESAYAQEAINEHMQDCVGCKVCYPIKIEEKNDD